MPPCILSIICHKPHIGVGPSWLIRKIAVQGRRSYGSTTQLERLEDAHSAQRRILTALSRTSVILPDVLPPAMVSGWLKLLRTSGDILSGATIRRPRIAVLGLDELSQPHELVTALLDDPLVSDKNLVQALRGRRRQSPHDLIIISPGESQQSGTRLCFDLPWLKKMDVDILEIPSGHPDTIPLLHDADIRILVASPFARAITPPFQSLLSHPGSFLVLEDPTFNHHAHQLSRLLPTISDTITSKTLRVDPLKALAALDIFREGSTSADAIQTFQNDFLSSGVTALSQSIARVLSSEQDIGKAHNSKLVLTGALEVCRDAIQLASHESAEVQRVIDNLRSQISEVRVTSAQDVLGGSDTPEIWRSVERSTREMRKVIDAIPWWKLPFKVDDLSGIMFHAAEHVWCRDLQPKLEFQTGRLAFLQSTLVSKTLATLRQLPPSFHSAILVNQLHQLSARPPELAPSTLTQPLSTRLRQLQQPILSLHRRAQHDTLSVSFTTLGSVGAAYAAWLIDWMAYPTAMGFGAFGFVVGLRWFVARWEKGKQRWWENWRRLGDGLERDIEARLALVINEKVTSVPSKAAEELEQLVVLRLRKIEQWNEELKGIESSFRPSNLDQCDPVE